MKFSAILAVSAFAFTFLGASAAPVSNRSSVDAGSVRRAATTTGVDPALVPEFGVTAGVNPTGSGDCDGINGPNGTPIKIPCSCPPDRQAFIDSLSANVAAGHDINNPSVLAPFPTDDSVASNITRLQTSISSLQNLNGPGKGCPAASTTFSAQLKALTG